MFVLYVNGNSRNSKLPPRNRGLVIAALQLIVLEQRGIVTAKLIEANAQ